MSNYYVPSLFIQCWLTKTESEQKYKEIWGPSSKLEEGRIHDPANYRQKVVATLWKDAAIVANLTTSFTPIVNENNDTVTRKLRKDSGEWEDTKVTCPVSLIQYNTYMGRVDRHDHLRSSYSLQRPNCRWWHYFVWFAIDVALINSYIVYAERHPRTSHKKFQLEVNNKNVFFFTCWLKRHKL